MKSFLIIVCFALLSNFANALEIKKTTFAYWDKPDVEILYITPNAINEDTEVIFVIHGNSRNADDYLSAWIPLVQNKNVIIAAPNFDKKNFRYFFLLDIIRSKSGQPIVGFLVASEFQCLAKLMVLTNEFAQNPSRPTPNADSPSSTNMDCRLGLDATLRAQNLAGLCRWRRNFDPRVPASCEAYYPSKRPLKSCSSMLCPDS